MEDIVVVTMSEFGRTAHENGNRGTDHGHANCMFVMGGTVKGGKVYTAGRDLGEGQLNEGRDLALTTDFRSVLGEIISGHLGTGISARFFPASRTIRGSSRVWLKHRVSTNKKGALNTKGRAHALPFPF